MRGIQHSQVPAVEVQQSPAGQKPIAIEPCRANRPYQQRVTLLGHGSGAGYTLNPDSSTSIVNFWDKLADQMTRFLSVINRVDQRPIT